MREWRGRNLDHARTLMRESARRSYAADPEAWRARQREYNRRHRDRIRARSIVTTAVARGKLIRPDRCPECGVAGRVEGHHSDYGMPLLVEWLCKACHERRHLRYPAA